MSSVLGIMRTSSPLSISPAVTIRLTSVAAIALVLFSTNLTTTTAQQQQQQQQQQVTAHQPAAATTTAQNGTLFQSPEDSFKVQVPRGWVIRDVDNAGSTLLTEVTQGYGILAQLCPEAGQQQQPQAYRNVTVGNNTGNSGSGCQGSEQGVIDILRYPNLSARLGLTENDFVGKNSNDTMNRVLSYELQKLQEVGYRDIRIVNTTSTNVKLDMSEAITAMNEDHNKNTKYNKNEVQNELANLKGPAKLFEMTYRLDSTPNEIRTGYFMLIATNLTPRNLGTINGYSLFYEGNPKGAATVTATTAITKASGGLPSQATMPPLAVRQVFGSFELIAGKEGGREILAALVAQAQARQAKQAEASGSAGPLRGELTSNGTDGVAPATFEFRAKIAGGVQPYIVNWNFGDGSRASNKQTVIHTFEEAGTYTVTATVMDHQHSTGSASMKITVKQRSLGEQQENDTCNSSHPELCLAPPPTVNSNCDDSSNSDNGQCETVDNQGGSEPREAGSADNGNLGSDNSASLLDLLNPNSSSLLSPESGQGGNSGSDGNSE
jgi:PKD repeat protein